MSAYTPDDVLPTPQRRIRHIASIQIRNLTPFPVRDALAQTLTQPAPKPSLLLQQPVDDIDLTMTARRRRRISASSLSTLLNVDAEDEGSGSGPGAKKQKRPSSKGNFLTPKNTATASAASTIRPRARAGTRPPTANISSASQFTDSTNLDSSGDWDSTPVGGQYVAHSQRTLEKIISSRLVASFVTLTLLASVHSGVASTSQPSSPPLSPGVSSSRKGKDVSVKRAISASVTNHRRGSSTSSSTSTLSATSSSYPKHRQSPSVSPPVSRTRTRVSGHTSVSSTKAANFPSPPPTPPRRSPSRNSPTPPPSRIHPTAIPSRTPENGRAGSPPIPTPFYISPLHLPSTNPHFSNLDPEREFAPWADLSCSQLLVAVWGDDYKLPHNNHGREDTKGKRKEAADVADDATPTKDGSHWKVLEEWVVDLDNMEPLGPDVADHQLPSNTLLLTVSSGETFRIAPVSSTSLSPPPSPPEPEYNSDGEVSETRRRRWERESDDRRREVETLEKSRRETRMKQSASWQDLVKIVNLQTCIVDTEESLKEIVRTCDSLVEEDGYHTSLREVSEREEWLRCLRLEREQVLQDATRLKGAADARRQALMLRRDILAEACALHEGDLLAHATQGLEVNSERHRHATLISSLSPLRTTLIQAVSSIFPIEPLSAPELLFTILGIPLPIPVSASDPAPPLSLSSRPEVTEDSTATALGYVAQVVQLLAAYLGKGLVYPVTCCGSRSIIKDPISAMMGPRMFPLYSKGVENYRFEYGVFLLNKNIEMLMMDRNLRAMDMRHTLPNLMNLLLTLTTGEGAKQTRFASPIPIITASDVQSPSRAAPPLAVDASQSEPQCETRVETINSRKATPFLSPLAAILRARYPSSAGRPSVKVVDETPEPLVDGDRAPDASFDQRTDYSDDIPGPDAEGFKAAPKTKGSTNPRSSIVHSDSLEKLAKCNEPTTPPSPLLHAT